MVGKLALSVVDHGGVMVGKLALSVVDHGWCDGWEACLECGGSWVV